MTFIFPPALEMLIYVPGLQVLPDSFANRSDELFLSKAAPIFWGSELAFLGCTVLAGNPISSKANYLLGSVVLSLFINSHFLSQK